MNSNNSLTDSPNKRKPVLAESKLQSNFIKSLTPLKRRYPCLNWLHAVPNGGSRHFLEAVRLKREGVVPGIADLFLPFPTFDAMKNLEYAGLYIEVKSENGRQTDAQKQFQLYCEQVGYCYVVIRSVQQGIDLVLDYLGGRIGKKSRHD